MTSFGRVSQTLLACAAIAIAGCSPAVGPERGSGEARPQPLTLYSGRAEALVGPLVERFTQETGVEVRSRYAETAELAAALLEEGNNSPADVFFAQDAGALGVVANRGMLATLPAETLSRVDGKFQARDGSWVGVSGRARVIAYNTSMLSAESLPESLAGLTDARWQGKIGWAPTNASLQASITAMRLLEGEATTRQWLEGIKRNSPKVYRNNTAIVEAVATGEIEVGLVNHYYLYGVMKERGSVPVRNYHPSAGGAGAIVNVAGAGILKSTKNPSAAQRFLDYLLSSTAQQYFAEQTFEYPLVSGIPAHADLVPLAQINHPDVDLSSLAELEGTLRLMREVGVL